jgi:hypothetical protein
MYPFASKEPKEAIRVSVPPVGAVGDLPRSCGLYAMEAGWISTPVGKRAPFSFVRIQVCWGSAQMVAVVSSSPIKYFQFNPISTTTSRNLWELCDHQELLLIVGIFGSSRSFIGGSSFFFVSRTNVAF